MGASADGKWEIRMFRHGIMVMAFFFALFLAGCARADDDMELETLVRELGNASPWTPEKVERITGLRLEPAGNPGDRDLKAAANVVFAERFTLRAIDLRIRAPAYRIGLMALEIAPAPCFSLERLQKTWPGLAFSEPPSPHGNMPVYYNVREAWGRLSFGFAHKDFKPTCLVSIVFLPNKELETLIRALADGGWRRLDRIEFALGAQLTGSRAAGGYHAENVEGVEPYETGLRFASVRAKLAPATQAPQEPEISRLTLALALPLPNSGCFSLTRLRQTWPHLPRPVRTEQETIRFGFDRHGCLKTLAFTEK
jgi:hypothetical protein